MGREFIPVCAVALVDFTPFVTHVRLNLCSAYLELAQHLLMKSASCEGMFVCLLVDQFV